MNQLVVFDPDKNLLSIGNITPPSEVSVSETKEDSERLSLSSVDTKCHIDETLGDLTIVSTFDLEEEVKEDHVPFAIPNILEKGQQD